MKRAALAAAAGIAVTWIGWGAYTYGRQVERRDCVRPASWRVVTHMDWERLEIRSCPMAGACAW